MGTRHLIVVEDKKGKIKIAQYGQWDGYFKGQGMGVLDFIKNPVNIRSLNKGLKHVRFFTKKDNKLCEELSKAWQDGDDDVCEYTNRFISRDVGSDILTEVSRLRKGSTPMMSCEKVSLKNSYEFGMDSLFCEYAYVLRMKDEVLEVYTGFNHDEGRQVRWKMEEAHVSVDGESKYWGVALLAEIPFVSIQKEGTRYWVKALEKMQNCQGGKDDGQET